MAQLVLERPCIRGYISLESNYQGPAKSRNPRAKKRNPTPATKSTATPPKANYRNPPALDREPWIFSRPY